MTDPRLLAALFLCSGALALVITLRGLIEIWMSGESITRTEARKSLAMELERQDATVIQIRRRA
jgi:hypothetical protein